MRRYQIGRRQPFSGRIFQTFAALGHHVSAEKLLEISKKIPKIAILTGNLDGIVNTERSKDLHDIIPGSEYIVFKGGGHALPSQFAKRYNQTVERIINEGKQKIYQNSSSS